MKANYVTHMGNDLTVVNSARVSFNKHVTEFSDKEAKLIRYLANNSHWTPFSHCQITLRETVPIFIARQRFKHMVGFTYNEVSRRYVDDKPEFYKPKEWRKRAENKKQGSSDEILEGLDFDQVDYHYHVFLQHVEDWYNEALEMGVAPEMARMALPQATYTSYYCTGSLAAWARAYNLRSGSTAQKEIQELAKQWDMIIRPLYPVSWEALTNKG